jgi:hypothetical protein
MQRALRGVLQRPVQLQGLGEAGTGRTGEMARRSLNDLAQHSYSRETKQFRTVRKRKASPLFSCGFCQRPGFPGFFFVFCALFSVFSVFFHSNTFEPIKSLNIFSDLNLFKFELF